MSFGGIAAVHRLVTKLGLVQHIDDRLELLKVHLPHRPDRWARSLLSIETVFFNGVFCRGSIAAYRSGGRSGSHSNR